MRYDIEYVNKRNSRPRANPIAEILFYVFLFAVVLVFCVAFS